MESKLKLEIVNQKNNNIIGIEIDDNTDIKETIDGIKEMYASEYKGYKELDDEAKLLQKEVEDMDMSYASTAEAKSALLIKLLQWLSTYNYKCTFETFKFEDFKHLDTTAFDFTVHSTVLAQITHVQNMK